jgi:isochorismate hydrolase
LKDQKKLVLLEHILNSFLRPFHGSNLNKHVLAVSHLTVTLQMMSENHRPLPVITTHLPIDQQAEDNGLITESLK